MPYLSEGNMKCIAYVSRTTANERGITLPAGLSNIVQMSRKRNPAAQITGILSYRHGQYVQVLEGPAIEIDNLMAKVAADPRHRDLWVFVSEQVTNRSFDSWRVSVFDFIDQGPIFKTFIEHHQQTLSTFTDEQKRRLQDFITLDKTNTVATHHYDGKHLRLLAWPDLNRTDQPQLIMSLCVKLTKSPYPFDSLVTSGEFGTYQQITDIIKDFESTGILTVSEPAINTAPKPAKRQETPTKKPSRFYGAIKRFLGMG
ncbi:BLUF domain-containing protein [Psychrobacter sp. 1Y11]|uniref:BLUF domain-containing protein n=1 Tax=Psychrobacter sp. 1Y11 TaxID=3457446 RepID=UPI003FD5755B